MGLIRPTALAILAVLVAMLVAACGGGSGTTSTGTTATSTAATATSTAATATSTATTTTARAAPLGARQPGAFAWLHPEPVSPAWTLVHVPGTATAVMAYPSSWRRIHSDPGTVSAARMDPGSDLIAQYLNATPQQGEETLQGWSRFRPAHNVEEGDSHVQVLAAARGLRFRNGHGSCVIDRYHTPATTYQEIACLVRGPHGGNVIVASALAAQWAKDAPALERAVSAFLA